MTDHLKQVRDRVSIVITVYNCDDLVSRCLSSLSSCLGGIMPETIVVDNAGLDTTKELMGKLGVRYERMPKDGGFAGANNVGYKFCTKEFVCLVNSDTVFHENPFSELIDFMDAHPKAQIAQGTVILRNGVAGEDGKTDDSGVFLSPMGTIEMTQRLLDPSDPRILQPSRVFSAYGAMFFIRNGWHNHVGGFLFYDHFYAYNEELDLCHRTWIAGGEVWYVPTKHVDHAHSATFKRNFDPRPIRKHLLYNCRFSLLTCLSVFSALKIIPLFECYFYGMAIIATFKGNFTELSLQTQATIAILKDIRMLLNCRRTIQATRTAKDSVLFQTIMKPKSMFAYIDLARKRRKRKK